MAIAALVAAPPGAGGQGIDAVAASHLSTLSPGLVVVLHEDGAPSFVDAWGLVRQGGSDSLTAEMLFPAPEVTSFLLDAVLHALHDAGRLGLDEPITAVVPQVVSASLDELTLRQLLEHTGGLDDARPRDGWSWDRLLEDVEERWFFAEPGRVVSTSRYSHPLAVRILEEVTGRRLAEVLQAVVLDPLGMERSTFDLERARALGLAPGFRESDSPETPVQEVQPEARVDGLPVLFTTAPDLARLFGAWLSGGIRGTSPLDEPVAGVPAPRSLEGRVHGLARSEWRGVPRLRLASEALGGALVVEVLPRAGIAVVGWRAGTSPGRATNYVMDRVAESLGLGSPAAAEAAGEGGGAVEASRPLPELAGEYVNGDEKLELRVRGEELVWFDGARELEMRRRDARTLTVHIPDGRVALVVEVLVDTEGATYLYRGGKGYRRP